MQGSILVVEHDAATRELVAGNLRSAGYQVTRARDFSEAEALVPLLDDPDEREEAAFIRAVDLAREVRLAGKTDISSTVEPKTIVKARAALKAFAETYPDSMRAASASVILQGLDQAQR